MFVSVNQGSCPRIFRIRPAHATNLMGTLKPPPARASCQGRFPEEAFGLSLDAVRFAPVWSGFRFVPSGRDGRGRKFKDRRTTMTDTKTNENTGSKAPTHIAYQVRDREGKKGFWTRIGSAWPHADGKGFNIQLEVVPLDGRITLRVASEKKE